MRHELRVWIKWPDGDGDWQSTVVTTNPDEHTPIPVIVEPEITMQGANWLDGYTFDSEALEEKLQPYIGDNSLGEAIFLSMNEGQEECGCYFVDQSECYGRTDRAHQLPNARPVCVAWSLAHIIETNGDLANACAGNSSAANPRRAPAPDDEGYTFHKEFNHSNDRWRITRKHDSEPDDHLATVQTERLADIMLAMLNSPEIVITVRQGMIEAVCCPYDFLPTVQFIVVDRDYACDEPESDNDVEVIDESGNTIRAYVSQPDLCHPTGASDSDRLVDAFLSRGASAPGV